MDERTRAALGRRSSGAAGPHKTKREQTKPEAIAETAPWPRWPVDVTDGERAAMAEMGVEPGFNDYSSGCVLDAYRLKEW